MKAKKGLKHQKAILTAVAAFILILIGFFAWRQSAAWKDGGSFLGPQYLERVDRGMSAEDRAKFDGQILEMQATIEKQIQENKRDVSYILALGNLYYTIGELKLAEEQYRDILSTLPNDAPALENLGQVQLEKGDYEGAEESWLKAVSASPYELTYLRLADLIRERIPEHKDRLKPLLENAVANLGQTYALMIRLGDWYAADGQYDRAVSHYEVALQLEPDSPDARQQLEEYRAKWREQQAQAQTN
jgi:tetratricopeptide (TPR) repeat protein